MPDLRTRAIEAVAPRDDEARIERAARLLYANLAWYVDEGGMSFDERSSNVQDDFRMAARSLAAADQEAFDA